MSKQFSPTFTHLFLGKTRLYLNIYQTEKIKIGEEGTMCISDDSRDGKKQTKTFRAIPRNWTLLIRRPHINFGFINFHLPRESLSSIFVFRRKINSCKTIGAVEHLLLPVFIMRSDDNVCRQHRASWQRRELSLCFLLSMDFQKWFHKQWWEEKRNIKIEISDWQLNKSSNCVSIQHASHYQTGYSCDNNSTWRPIKCRLRFIYAKQ